MRRFLKSGTVDYAWWRGSRLWGKSRRSVYDLEKRFPHLVDSYQLASGTRRLNLCAFLAPVTIGIHLALATLFRLDQRQYLRRQWKEALGLDVLQECEANLLNGVGCEDVLPQVDRFRCQFRP